MRCTPGLLALVIAATSPLAAVADRRSPPPSAPSPKDLGAWDCSGSPVSEQVIPPGEHAFVWRGECSGAEGFSAVVEPKPASLVTREAYDAKTKRLVLRVENRGSAPIRVKLHVFVGFA